MSAGLDPADVSIIYDTARGFIGLKSEDEILRHALLSLMGSCGARFVAYFERTPRNRLALRAARGVHLEDEPSLRLTARAEQVLAEDPGPHDAPGARWLDPQARALVRRHAVEFIAGVTKRKRVGGVFAIGPKILGEAFTRREASLIREMAEMTGLALLPDAEAAARKRGAAAAPRAQALRDKHPALDAIRGDGAATRLLLSEIVSLADFDLPVLLCGETGTGKELVARALHDLSPRAEGAFEAINCAAIPPDLMPSALFGHERGAFTGAVSMARGAFERAGAGTLFLDEIGDMPFATQATLLRVLQERQFRRVGGETLIPARARIISATNHDLAGDVKSGRFRADLFYRVRMYAVRIPPLRERKDEIPGLVEHILERHGVAGRVKASAAFLADLAHRGLPGNVRELEGLVLAAVVRAGRSGILLPKHVARDVAEAKAPRFAETKPGSVPSYDEMEREYILSVLRLTEGNRKQAAALMGIPRTTLNARMKKLRIGDMR